MAYIKPAVQVYQDLVNAGGAQQLSPDMAACIVGTAKTVIDVDFDDSLSKTNSIGTTDDTDQVPATFAEIPAVSTPVFINHTSRKTAQANVETGRIFAENAVVQTVELTGTITSPGTDIVVTVSNVLGGGSTGAPVSITDPLPFNSNVNHVSIGDTVVEYLASDVVATSYVTEVNVEDGTISLADTTDFTGSSALSVFHKFAAVEIESSTAAAADVIDAFLPMSPHTVATLYSIDSEKTVESLANVPVADRPGDDFSIYIEYVADRADLSGDVLTVNDIDDLTIQLGSITIENELAFGVSLALANSGGTAINAIALDPNLSATASHTKATELAQAQRMYCIVPLTQELSIQAIYQKHVNAMSLPESAKWRVAMVNCEVPEMVEILGKAGTADSDDDGDIPDGLIIGTLNSGGANPLITLDRPNTTAGVVAGRDVLFAVHVSEDEDFNPVYTYSQADIINKTPNQLEIDVWTNPVGGSDPVDGVVGFYVAKFASKQEQAQWVADQSKTWIDKRVWNFPGSIYVLNENELEEEVPGYFLQAALSGFISGSPAQQPITNIAIAGITDLIHGNFYFTEAQMNLMAEFGTLLYAQNNQGTTPYCRHGLTTDVSVLEYREILKVKNWDYLSYYYYDILNPFIGTWNITPDTIQTIRQTVISASESLLTRKLPKIGAPLLSYDIQTLEQNATSLDAIDLYMNVAIVSPTNYVNTHLVI